MKDFTVVIAHRGEPMGLWATVHSCEAELENQGFDYNYSIVWNGESKFTADCYNTAHYLDKAGKLKQLTVHPEPMSPPQARQQGVLQADGKYLFFLDNHCLVGKDYFKRAVADFKHYDMDMLHSTTRFYSGEATHYHYKLTLDYNFWACSDFVPKHPLKPYKIAVGGHGGFAVKRDVWNEVGGYGPSGLFKGYGGEEVYFDLKMWLLGKTNYIDPRVIHYHYAGKRGYSRHYTDEFYINMMACANVIGGEKWLYKVCESFQSKFSRKNSKKTMFDLMVTAYERSKDHALELNGKRTKTLDELLAWFTANEVAW